MQAIRAKLGLGRPVVAERFGLAVAVVRDWEQGTRQPDQAACVLLMVISRSPDAVSETVTRPRVA